MVDLASQWFARHFRGKLSDSKRDSEAVLRLMDYAVQFDKIQDEAEARSFFGTHSSSITRQSQEGTLDFASLLMLLHAFSGGQSSSGPVPSIREGSLEEARDLFGGLPVQRRIAARTPTAAPKARKGSLSDEDLIQEAIAFGEKFGVFVKNDDLSNFEAYTRANLPNSRADDPGSRPSEIVARFLAEQTDFFRVQP